MRSDPSVLDCAPHPRDSRKACRTGALAVGAALSICAVQAQPDFCLRDADHDGHPMFGNPQVRTGFETWQGANYASAKAVAVAFGDLDGDGDADAAAISNWPHVLDPQLHFVTVHRNAGDGVFEPADMPYPVGKEGTDVTLGDLDRDGDLDAAVANARADSVSILLNHGDATFAAHVTYGAGQMPRSLRTADLDGDGDLDLAVLNVTSDDVSILRNQGDGTFAPEVRVFVGNVTPRGNGNLNFPYPGPFLAVGDLDGDGDRDVAVPARTKVKLLLNDGLGSFALAGVHPSVAIADAYCVALANLDGDTDADLAVSCLYTTGGPNCLSVVVNQGGGAFGPPVSYNAGWSDSPTAVQWAASITAGDIDADLDIDLVVGHELRSHVMLLRNLGNGTFGPKEPVHVFTNPWYVRFAELNGDSRLDLGVLTMAIRSKLCVLLNNGEGSLITDVRYPPTGEACCQSWNWLESADLDGDGDADLVAAVRNSAFPYQVKVLLNTGAGAFGAVTSYSLGPSGMSSGERVSVGDLTGDSIPDLAVADTIVPGGFDQPGKVWTMRGQGDGTFAPSAPISLPGLVPHDIAITDFDGDADHDMAVWVVEVYPGNDITPVDRRVVLLLNDGAGGFAPSGELIVGTVPYPFPFGSVLAVDLNGDGNVDLAATAGTWAVSGRLVVFLNDGAGRFNQNESIEVPAQPESMASLDLNGDGVLDLLLLHNHNFSNGVLSEPYLSGWINSGVGQLSEGPTATDPRALPLGRLAVQSAVAADPPLFAFGHAHGFVTIGTLTPWGLEARTAHAGAGNWPTAAVLADFDLDERVDLAVSNNSEGASVTLNRACDGCYPDCDGDSVLGMPDFVCFQTKFLRADPYADCNADGGLTVADFGCFQTRFVAGCR